MFRRALSREEEHSTKLQAQLDQQKQEIQHLEAEVTRRGEHEAQLQNELDRASSAGSASAPAAPTPVPAALSPSERRHQQAVAAGVIAGLRAALADERTERKRLEKQLAELKEAQRQSESEPLARSGSANAREAPTPAPAALSAEQRLQQQAEAAGAITGLRAALADERAQRKEVENELARLKEETSTPPYGPDRATQAALAAAKQEVASLRAELDKERAARETLATEFQALQERDAAAQAANTSSPELQARLHQLEEEKQNITRSFERSLAESQQRTAELERQLAEARSAPAATAPTASEVAAVRAENENLRSRLDAEHQRTEKLAAKLRIATRVTDLIFKMQAQQAQPPPATRR